MKNKFLKSKKVKLFNKNEVLNVIMDKRTNMVSFAVEDKKGSIFTNDELRLYINYCDTCGKMFVTKNHSENICEECENIKKGIDKSFKSVLDSLKSLFSIKEVKADGLNIKDVQINIGDNNDEPKAESKPTKNTSKGRKRENYPAINKATEKYYNYCKLRSDLVTPKNLKKYIERGTWRINVNPYLIKSLFHLVYKGSSVDAIANTFNLSRSSVIRYLDHMCSMGLVYHDYGRTRYFVCPNVEVETK